MQVSVEAGEGLKRRMRVGLPIEQVELEVDKRLRQMARTARLSGFRPGKVPVKVLRQRYLDQVHRELIAELVSTTLPEALSQQQLDLAGRPHIEPEIDPAAGRYGYTASFEVMPTVELGDLSGKTIKRPLVELTDADVAAVIERLREQRKTWRPVERPAQLGDLVTVDYHGRLAGAGFDGGDGIDVRIELGGGRLMPGFEDGLVGAAAGEQRALRLRFGDEHRDAALRGQEVEFDVTVKAVSEPQLPEVDADFARAFGIEDGDLERFRGDVKANMTRELRQRTSARVKAQVMDALIEVNPIPLPESLIEDEIASLKAQALEGVPKRSRVDLPDGVFAGAARRRVALGLILRAVIKQQGLSVDSARVRTLVEDIAASYESPQEVISYYYADPKRLAPVESLALEEQVVDWVMQLVKVEDDPMSFHDLSVTPEAGG